MWNGPSIPFSTQVSGEVPNKAECFLRVELGSTMLLQETPRRALSQLGPVLELEDIHVSVPCDPCQPPTLASVTVQPLLSE
jgi:hypothetical protein